MPSDGAIDTISLFRHLKKIFQLTTIQVSYNSIVCNNVEHVEFCAWKQRFADSIDFLLSFEENCCRIASNAVEAYGEHVLGKSQCFEFKNSKVDFNVRNEERGKPSKKFEDSELQALFDEGDTQTQQ